MRRRSKPSHSRACEHTIMERQHRALEAKTVYIELIGELERRAVDALDTAVAEIGDAAVVVSLKRAHGTRWNA